MRCPRCSLTELSEAVETCWLCGYSPATAGAEEARAAEPSELDARRELAREFRIDSLLERPPGPIVYRARDADERPVALKVVARPQVGAAEDRFHAAADAAAQLDHPHIVPVYRHGATENFLWCATKYVDGRSLASMLETAGPLELTACLRIFEQVASALDYAHRRGVAHGALTPDCILVDANEWALVGDFAMRGLLDAVPDGAQAGEPAAGRDQRALAAIAHQCLTGTPLGEDPPTAEDNPAGLPLHVSQALRRALSSRQADRFPSVLDFVGALGGSRPDARTAWFGANPRKKGPGSPVVIVDADVDPAARPLRRRPAAPAAIAGGAARPRARPPLRQCDPLGERVPRRSAGREHPTDRSLGHARRAPAAGGARGLPALRPYGRRGVGAAASHHRHRTGGAVIHDTCHRRPRHIPALLRSARVAGSVARASGTGRKGLSGPGVRCGGGAAGAEPGTRFGLWARGLAAGAGAHVPRGNGAVPRTARLRRRCVPAAGLAQPALSPGRAHLSPSGHESVSGSPPGDPSDRGRSAARDRAAHAGRAVHRPSARELARGRGGDAGAGGRDTGAGAIQRARRR